MSWVEAWSCSFVGMVVGGVVTGKDGGGGSGVGEPLGGGVEAGAWVEAEARGKKTDRPWDRGLALAGVWAWARAGKATGKG